ncbi:Uncharacterised protein [Yersinia frederiksenii]|nr:Uncharacterised protein [Yersinia frederiksenii]CQI92404.1 Uncharacterised protein [Yersinia frederiksenii]
MIIIPGFLFPIFSTETINDRRHRDHSTYRLIFGSRILRGLPERLTTHKNLILKPQPTDGQPGEHGTGG